MAISFFSFILWIIYLANTGQESIFFRLVASLPYGDKIGHFFLFGILTLIANFAFKLRKVKVLASELYLGAILVFLFAFFEELSQTFFANRTLDASDLLFDCFGIITFSIVTLCLSKKLLTRN